MLELDHVNLRTRQLSALRAFYADVLGLKEGPRPPFGHPGAWLYAGERPIIHPWLGTEADTAPPPAAGVEPQLSHFAFTGTDRAALLARLRAAAVPFEEQPLAGRDAVQVKLRDPDGNALHIDFAMPAAPANGGGEPEEEELTCGRELAAAVDVPKAWAELMRHVVVNLERHARWVGTAEPDARREHDGLLAVAASYRDMALAADRAAEVMSQQRDLAPVAHDPAARDLARDRAWMKAKIALQRALADLLSSHAAASSRALAAWDEEPTERATR